MHGRVTSLSVALGGPARGQEGRGKCAGAAPPRLQQPSAPRGTGPVKETEERWPAGQAPRREPWAQGLVGQWDKG